ncbi:hypothetical protein DM02DRAFT_665535 [Periconia macrospinosa]|uniref:BZIP domain-containing protein n=1 Tax=Periconia macrospinosa TaxID=97972 RepID=A0A2V1CXV5_9PLEO|nr:hypothetical protein DM02DRAFT_665535 [Periconia macrospinosa]
MAQKPKTSRKSIYTTSEERRQQNRKWKAAFRARRKEHTMNLEKMVEQLQITVENQKNFLGRLQANCKGFAHYWYRLGDNLFDNVPSSPLGQNTPASYLSSPHDSTTGSPNFVPPQQPLGSGFTPRMGPERPSLATNLPPSNGMSSASTQHRQLSNIFLLHAFCGLHIPVRQATPPSPRPRQQSMGLMRPANFLSPTTPAPSYVSDGFNNTDDSYSPTLNSYSSPPGGLYTARNQSSDDDARGLENQNAGSYSA